MLSYPSRLLGLAVRVTRVSRGNQALAGEFYSNYSITNQHKLLITLLGTGKKKSTNN